MFGRSRSIRRSAEWIEAAQNIPLSKKSLENSIFTPSWVMRGPA
jgi:hypothetical protein